MLEEYGKLGAKPSSVPMEVNIKIKHTTEDVISDPIVYKQLIGKVMYIALTRPDIAYSIHVLSQFMDKSSQTHMKAGYKVLNYLKNALGQGLYLDASSKLILLAYSNSDWASCVEIRISLTRFCIFLEQSLIS
ncbi:uncharacterized mitochondrial protein AtMg00240-like [Manihot esculenta]|uniref:uncharacterized mitochondrial protein AtMg00240-like n=1 Tax=Manihot esculenta TaxID=3983 RepID=UPI000B5D7DEA|nr:uncharacterized mitochondrial protein AtMg00240-like [Manihot esculenta]